MTNPGPSTSVLATAPPAPRPTAIPTATTTTPAAPPSTPPADISAGVFSGIAAFEAAQRMAQALCTSTMVPSEYRGQQGLSNSLIALEIAARMGLSPLVVMQNMTPIHGKPSWSSSFLIATVNASGRFTPLRFVFDDKDNPSSCFALARDKTTGEELEGQLISIEMAKREGWWSRPDRYGKETSKWQSMTGQMLRYRAAAFWVKVYCPEISLGLMSQDEVADMQAVVVDSVEPLAMPQLPARPGPLPATRAGAAAPGAAPAADNDTSVQLGAEPSAAPQRRSSRRSSGVQKQTETSGQKEHDGQQRSDLPAAATTAVTPADAAGSAAEQAELAADAAEPSNAQEPSSTELLNKALRQITGLSSVDALDQAHHRVNRLLAEGRLTDEGAQRLWSLIQQRLQQLEAQGPTADASGSDSSGAEP